MEIMMFHGSKDSKKQSPTERFKKMMSEIDDKSDIQSIISLFPKNILHAPLQTINEDYPSKSILLTHFEENPAFECHFFISPKEGGVNPSGIGGGREKI
jgi:hypothetical protein